MYQFYYQYFQLPEDLNKYMDYFVQFMIALVGVGGAYLVFYAQKNNEFNNLRNAQQDHEKRKLKYLNTLVTRIIIFTKYFIESLQEFLNRIEKEPLDFEPIGVGAVDDLVRVVSKIDQEEFYHAFSSQNKENGKVADRDIVAIFYSIDVIKRIVDNTIIDLDDRNKNFLHKRKVKYSSIISEIFDLILIELSSTSSIAIHDTYKRSILFRWKEKLDSINSKKDENFREINTNFLLHIQKDLNEIKNLDFNPEFYKLTDRASTAFSHIVFTNIDTANDVQKSLTEIRKAYKILVEGAKSLNDIVERKVKD